MTNEVHQQFMEQAIALSASCLTHHKGGPFGALIVKDGDVIAVGVNEVIGNFDPTAHAEVQAIRSACEKLGTFNLSGCTIYSSCEPCPMCLAAIYWARIDAVYFANSREDAAEIGFDDAFFYEELNKNVDKRKIPSYQVHQPEAKAVFSEWQKSSNKHLY